MNSTQLLQWLDLHPAAYWSGAAAASLALLAAALFPRPAGDGRARAARWLFPLLLLGVLVAWRWPYLLFPDELNPDESQFIAGANTLRHDPVFWRSVDGMSAGPLVYYALLPWRLAGLPLGYLTARLTGLLLIWLSLVLCYRILRTNYGEQPARLGVLTGTLFIASVLSNDLNHYSSELTSLPLMALALGLLTAKNDRPWIERHRWALGGLAAGCLPWAKLQSGPIGAMIVLGGLGLILGDTAASARLRLQRCLAVVGGALVPALGFAGLISLGGVWRDFWNGYVLQNLYYAGVVTSPQWILPQFLNTEPTSLSVLAYMGSPLLLIALASALPQKTQPVFRLAGLVFIVAVGCVLLPRRNFLHYTMLLVVPLVLWGGAALGECLRVAAQPGLVTRAARTVLWAGLAVLLIARFRASAPPMLGELDQLRRNPLSEIAAVFRELTLPGDKLAVWGWNAQAYVKNDLTQATRSAFSYWSITDSPLREFNRGVFLADFARNRPEVFLDAVGPTAMFYKHRDISAHETFPALAEVIRADYRLVADLDHARVFARRDLLERRQVTPDRIKRALAGSRLVSWRANNLPAEDLGLQRGAHYRLGERTALMLLPPRQASWTLQGNERVLLFDCGYHPAAVNQTEGNGTQFYVELLAPDGARRTLSSFFLNPALNPADRLRQSKRVVLPLYLPGSAVIVRTEPGPDQSDNWDWVYLDHVRFLRSPRFHYSQFPGFNRIPDEATGPLSTVLELGDEPLALLHAPARVGYRLHGHERSLRFAFGFVDGAHQGPEKTDGAIFRVVLVAGDSRQVLFQRRLNPADTPGDRGRQHTEVAVPAHAPGARLTVSVNPGGNNAFDWTYITDLQLDD